MAARTLSAPPGSAAESPLVLIAERDRNVRDLQAHFLGRSGFRFAFVEDGQAALEFARAHVPGLVVTEILLPRMDGLTLCRQLKADPVTSAVPVLVFSILAAGSRAYEAGANGYLRKPLVELSFLAAIENAVGAQAPIMVNRA